MVGIGLFLYIYGKYLLLKALVQYKLAAKSNNSLAIRGKIAETVEKCYRKYFMKGMDFYNAWNYAAAKVEFEKAKDYKDFSQVRGMIEKCEAALN